MSGRRLGWSVVARCLEKLGRAPCDFGVHGREGGFEYVYVGHG